MVIYIFAFGRRGVGMKKNNIENDIKLTINDLLIGYMITKIELGYEPMYTMDEFEVFFELVSGRLNIEGKLDDRKVVLDNFYNQMYEYYWIYMDGEKRIETPHINRIGDDLLVANNRLGRHDIYTTNICKIKKKERDRLKKYMKYFLYGQKKRKINTEITPTDKNIELAKETIIKLIYIIIKNYYTNLMDERLFNIDASAICGFAVEDELPFEIIERDLIDFYVTGVKRIACLLEQNPELVISNDENFCIPYANYKFIMKYYGNFVCLSRDSIFTIDTKNEEIVFNNSCEPIAQLYMNDVKKLVRTIDTKYKK